MAELTEIKGRDIFEGISGGKDIFEGILPGISEEEARQSSSATKSQDFLGILSETDIATAQKKGKIGFLEAVNPQKMIPFYSTAKEAGENVALLELIGKAKKGDEVAKSLVLEEYKKRIEPELRGFSIGGMIGEGLNATIPFMGELASAIGLAAPTGSGSLAAAGAKKISERVLSETVKKGLMDIAGEKAKESLATKAAKATFKGAVLSAAMPQQAALSFTNRLINQNISLTDKGEIILKDADEKPALTALKAFGDVFTTNISEMAGGKITEGVMKVGGKVFNKLGGEAISHAALKILQNPKAATFKNALGNFVKKLKPDADVDRFFRDKLYYNGIIGELGEERLDAFLKTSLGLNETDKPMFEQYMEALYPGHEELLAELGIITFIGGAREGISFAKRQLADRLKARGMNAKEAKDRVDALSEYDTDYVLNGFKKYEEQNPDDSIPSPPVEEVPLSKIKLSAEVPNFKEGANELGVVEGEELQGKYERMGTAPIVLWERLNGDLEVITGRHRLDLARRTGEPTIPSQIVREADGFTVQDARTFDAQQNIRDQKGSALDFTRYFKDAELGEEEAKKAGLLSRKEGKDAFSIARQGSEEVYTSFINGRITADKAAAISRAAPLNASAQAAGISKSGNMSASELSAYVSILNNSTPVEEASGDLFGFDDSLQIEAEKIAKAVAKDQKNIKERIAAVSGALRRPELAKQMGLAFKATRENILAEIEKLKARLDELSRFATNPELMNYYKGQLTEAKQTQYESIPKGGRVSSGADKSEEQLNKILDNAVKKNKDLIKKELKEIYNEFYELFKKNGDENTADKQARLLQGMVFFGAGETNLTPKEFLNTRFPKIKYATFDDYFYSGNKEYNQDSIDKLLTTRENGPAIASDDVMVEAVELSKTDIPSNVKMKDFVDWVMASLGDNHSIHIKSVNQDVLASRTGVRRSYIKASDTSKTVFAKLRSIIENAEYSGFEDADKEHPNVLGQDVYHSAMVLEGIPYSVKIKVDISVWGENPQVYAGHTISEIEIEPSGKRHVQLEASQNPLRGSIHKVSMAVLRGKVNPARYNPDTRAYLQSAFAGSGVDYDSPSLDAIGSGEGAQVHGWGLYYALNKDVAEKYRKRFAVDERVALFYDNEEISYTSPMGTIYKNMAVDKEYTKKWFKEKIKRIESGKENGNVKTYQSAFDLIDDIDFDKFEERRLDAGQVHEVDIPENPYLLDEQKTFEEQSDFVKSALETISKEYGIQVKGKHQAGVDFKDITGRYIYNKLAGILSSDKKASEKLHEYGIKGITYDGRQDGRCFVIFNPKDIKVIQKFYQSIQASITDVSTHEDPKQIRDDARTYLKDIVRKQDINHPQLGHIRVSGTGIEEFIKYSADVRKLALVPHLKEIIETSTVGAEEAPRHPRKDNIVKFIPLYNEAVIDGEHMKTETLIGVDNKGNLFYDVFLDDKRNRPKGGVEAKPTALSAVSDINISLSEESVNRHGGFNQNPRGMYDATHNILYMFENADASTFVHEAAHYFFEELQKWAEFSPKSKQMLNAVNSWLGHKEGTPYTTEEHEMFAKGAEAFLKEGKAPNNYLKAAFEAFAKLLAVIYKTAKHLDIYLSDEVRGVYEKMFGGVELDFYMHLADTEVMEDTLLHHCMKEDRLKSSKETDDGKAIDNLLDATQSAKGVSPWAEEQFSNAEIFVQKTFDYLVPLKRFGRNIYNKARLFTGVSGLLKSTIQFNTVDMTGKITGEGLVPIIKDFVREFKVSQKQAQIDLGDYLVARRYISLLENRKDVEVSEEQQAESWRAMDRLKSKYKDNFDKLSEYAKRIYEYQNRVSSLLVESGLMSKAGYEEMLKNNPDYIPLFRILEKERIPMPTEKMMVGRKLAGIRKPIKQLKGSELDTRDPFASIVNNTANIIINAKKNMIADNLAKCAKSFPGLVRKKDPITASYDKGLRDLIRKGIEKLGGTYERTSKRLSASNAIGVYLPLENKIKEKIGVDAALAHEFGHMLDDKLGLGQYMFSDEKVKDELINLANERLGAHLTEENGRFIRNTKEATGQYKQYIHSEPELIANLYDAYINAPELLRTIAPAAKAKLEEFIQKSEHEWLLDIHRTLDTGLEKMYGELDTMANVVRYYKNGMRRYIELKPELYTALNGVDPVKLPTVLKLFLIMPTTLVRYGATIYNIGFALLVNPIRDTQTAALQSGVGFIPVLDTVRGMGHKFLKTEEYRAWLAAGGSFSGFMQVNENSKLNPYEDLFLNASYFKYLNPFTIITKLGEYTEEGSRIAVFNKARKKGLSDADAALLSRDATIDFARGGLASKKANEFIPFLNSSVQSLNVMLESWKRNPVGMAVRCLAMLTLPSILLEWFYTAEADDEDKEWYNEIPAWQKNLFWNFKIGEKHIMIPKPFAYGAVFATLPQAVVGSYLGDKPFDGAAQIKNIFDSLNVLGDILSLIPPPVRVLGELAQNRNFYSGYDIVPSYLLDYDTSEQYTDRTSETVKLLANILPEGFDSPAMLEHAITSIGAGLAKDILALSDMAIDNNAPTKTLGEIPVLRRAIGREPIGFNSESVRVFRDTFKNAEKRANTLKLKEKDAEPEEIEAYEEKYAKELELYAEYGEANKEINRIAKEVRRITKDKDISPKDKREEINALNREMTDIASIAVKEINARK